MKLPGCVWLVLMTACDGAGGAGADGSGGGTDTVDTRPPLVCIANASYDCECPLGGMGRMRCIDGLTFEACRCGADDASEGAPEVAGDVADAAGVELVEAVEAVEVVEVVDAVENETMDTAPADTQPADTTPLDTGPADTTPVDTTPADTGSGDVGNADALSGCQSMGVIGGHHYVNCNMGATHSLAVAKCAEGGATLIRGDSAGVLFDLGFAASFSWLTARKVGEVWEWDSVDVTPHWCAGQPDGQWFGLAPTGCIMLTRGGACLDDAPCDALATVICEL